MSGMYDNTPTSNFEEDMRAIIDGTPWPDRPPKSKMEELLKELNDLIKAGGGGADGSWIGITTTPLTDGADTNPITIAGTSVTAVAGNITSYDNEEFIFNGSVWQSFGKLSGLISRIVALEGNVGNLNNLSTETKSSLVAAINEVVEDVSDTTAALADKVDKVSGKGLSSNDYTNEDKAIVDGVTSALAGKADIARTLAGYGITDAYTKSAVDTALTDKVDKISGKGLSTNDYTTEDKTKLDGLVNYDDTSISNRVSAIEEVVPSDATSSNKLATQSDLPSAVTGNPSGSATAGNLTKLQIGSDIYDVPSGGGSSDPYDGRKTRYTISASSWSSSPNSDGYYTYSLTLTNPLTTSTSPNVYIAGASDSTQPTATENTMFSYVKRCNLSSSTTLVLYASTKPTSTFYVFVGAEGGGGINYSTTEQDTGLTWIDGKKIYQKTYSLTLTNNNPQTQTGYFADSYWDGLVTSDKVAETIVGADIVYTYVEPSDNLTYTKTPAPHALDAWVQRARHNSEGLSLNAFHWYTGLSGATVYFTVRYTKV